MHSPVPSSDSSAAGKARFQPRAFWRMLGLTWGYRRTLILGLLCTTAFAGLHTVGIGWAFPVFKVLLEPEGVCGWAHRTAAARCRIRADRWADAERTARGKHLRGK